MLTCSVLTSVNYPENGKPSVSFFLAVKKKACKIPHQVTPPAVQDYWQTKWDTYSAQSGEEMIARKTICVTEKCWIVLTDVCIISWWMKKYRSLLLINHRKFYSKK